jgi:tRNA (guanine-N7-)-methyltransferase
VVRPGGVVHCATDWPDYAAAMAETLAADPGLIRDDGAGDDGLTRDDGAGDDGLIRDDGGRDDGGRRQRVSARPVTKFERRGTEAGRPIVDLVNRRAGCG